jgi:hypothetical protein
MPRGKNPALIRSLKRPIKGDPQIESQIRAYISDAMTDLGGAKKASARDLILVNNQAALLRQLLLMQNELEAARGDGQAVVALRKALIPIQNAFRLGEERLQEAIGRPTARFAACAEPSEPSIEITDPDTGQRVLLSDWMANYKYQGPSEAECGAQNEAALLKSSTAEPGGSLSKEGARHEKTT